MRYIHFPDHSFWDTTEKTVAEAEDTIELEVVEGNCATYKLLTSGDAKPTDVSWM